MPATLPPLPEPLPRPVVDGHTHLDLARRGEEVIPVGTAVARAAEVNVTRMVQIGCDPESARWSVAVAERNPEVLAGVALHPGEVVESFTAAGAGAAGERAVQEAFAEIERLCEHPRVRVIGETGLDYHWTPAGPGRAAQRDAFARHIDLAKRTGKVLQIHDRDAHADVLDVLAAEGAPDRTVFHCFSGDVEMARYCAHRGWYLSFAGNVTFANAGSLREAARAVPAELVLVETDAPYLAPVPYRGRTNASYLVPVIVRALSQVMEMDEESLCTRLAATAEGLYGPW
jgi:TatD DNase family protein